MPRLQRPLYEAHADDCVVHTFGDDACDCGHAALISEGVICALGHWPCPNPEDCERDAVAKHEEENQS